MRKLGKLDGVVSMKLDAVERHILKSLELGDHRGIQDWPAANSLLSAGLVSFTAGLDVWSITQSGRDLLQSQAINDVPTMTPQEEKIRAQALQEAMRAILPPSVPMEWMERETWPAELDALKAAQERVRALLAEARDGE